MTKVQVMWYNGIFVISGWKHHWAGPDRCNFVHTNADFWLRQLICLFNSFFNDENKKISRFVRTMDLLILSLKCDATRLFVQPRNHQYSISMRGTFSISPPYTTFIVKTRLFVQKLFWLTLKKQDFASLNCCEWTCWFPWTNDPQHRTFIGCNSTVYSRACSG